jgi:chemotaxis protein MotB
MRSPLPDARGGTDRWMVSYADFVTLLFAFFTTLYAASTMSSETLAPIATSLEQAFDRPDAAGTARRTEGDELYQRLSLALGDAIADNRLELIRDTRGLVVSLPDAATFGVGSADVTPEARALVTTVGDAVRASPVSIRVEGHTDNVPIRTSRYESNWELSTARAASVVAFLIEDVGLEASRMSAAGYGEFHPRGPNDTDADRARNRRVDLVILDDARP